MGERRPCAVAGPGRVERSKVVRGESAAGQSSLTGAFGGSPGWGKPATKENPLEEVTTVQLGVGEYNSVCGGVHVTAVTQKK